MYLIINVNNVTQCTLSRSAKKSQRWFYFCILHNKNALVEKGDMSFTYYIVKLKLIHFFLENIPAYDKSISQFSMGSLLVKADFVQTQEWKEWVVYNVPSKMRSCVVH